MKFQNYIMAALALELSREVERMVFDQTGLTGEFNFVVEATRQQEETNPFAAPIAPSLGDIGLRLESRRGPVEIYVVEAAERPSEN